MVKRNSDTIASDAAPCPAHCSLDKVVFVSLHKVLAIQDDPKQNEPQHVMQMNKTVQDNIRMSDHAIDRLDIATKKMRSTIVLQYVQAMLSGNMF